MSLSQKLRVSLYRDMVRSRVLEERLIKIYKGGESYFWIGAPGEEAFGVPLGQLINKGRGFDHDWLHLHYRGAPTLVAMGMPFKEAIRLSMNRSTDPCSGGRNFVNHYCFPEWNVAPVGSPIGVQFSMAIGTAWAQKRRKAKGITVVTGGDAGTAEGDFASSLIWATRKGQELPMLICVTNNRLGISTSYESQHGEEKIADRGRAFGMRTAVVDGNDPESSYICLKKQFEYIRKTGRPVLVEASVSRLYGHSSADGANRRPGVDSVEVFGEKLDKEGVLSRADQQKIWKEYEKQAQEIQKEVRQEEPPQSDSIWDHYYVGGESGNWRDF